MGTLYIVSTPIGNLKDITERAVDILGTVEYVACEDTRVTNVLLKYIGATQRPILLSHYEQNEFKRIPQLVTLLKNGKDIALVADAGTPAISDPGFRLIRACVDEGILVEAVPGPSSVVTALVVSGLPTDKFTFLGYLPHKQGNRTKLLENTRSVLELVDQTVILFESPHKLVRTLTELQNVFDDINIVVCRELTKMYEEVRREKISESISHFQTKAPRGEFVILFHP